MYKAYIILVHNKGDQLYRLITRLNDENSYFFIHIDKKAPLVEFQRAFNDFTKKIKLVKQVEIEWGSFALAEATLNAMQEVWNHEIPFQWITLLSGQDYPIKSNNYINRFLTSTNYAGFFDYTTLPDYNRWSPRGGYYRIDKYYLGLDRQKKLAAKALNLLAEIMPVVKRPVLENVKPYAGSQWWTINRELLKHILDFVAKYPNYSSFHKFTFAADEVFFHTIVMNSARFKNKVKNLNLHFYVWPDSSKPHPEILKESNFSSIKDSHALFARKFDVEVDNKVLDLIDDHCLSAIK